MNVETRHTPEPWTVGDPINDTRIGSIWEVTIWANAAQSGDKVVGTGCARDRGRARANATLMAAALKLLEACKAVVASWERGDLTQAARMCAAAIAKAEAE